MNSIGDAFSPEAIGKGEAQASPGSLELLQTLLDEGVQLEGYISQLQADLTAATRAREELRTRRLPELMDDLGLSEATRNGWKIKVSDIVGGSLPKEPEARERAFRWLTDNGHEGIIKNTVTLAFGKGEHNIAHDLAERLRAEGFEPNEETGVHYQTLLAWAREALAAGEPIDFDTLGLYTGRLAKFTPPKPKKG